MTVAATKSSSPSPGSPKPSNRDWERLCRRCGECCFEKWVEEDGTIRPTRIACRHLDITSRLCRVYHKRFDVGEGCLQLTPTVVARLSWLPETCGYRQWLQTSPSHRHNEGS